MLKRARRFKVGDLFGGVENKERRSAGTCMVDDRERQQHQAAGSTDQYRWRVSSALSPRSLHMRVFCSFPL
jgi:hypothetical protein